MVLRGYEPAAVDALLDQAEAATASADESVQAAARGALQDASFAVALRGYDRLQVDEEVGRLRAALGDGAVSHTPAEPQPDDFTVVLRGYDRGEVDRALVAADAALETDGEFARAAARDALRDTRFAVTWRGYDRGQVDRSVTARLQRLS
ncbi:hypothetical protein AFR_23270 [Actinoplanes friuliensis DSM 7358]|uniref:DivIVA domain-containing protein n=2 Tax=Actinoplanes friuliensis TaxID=196914 RepID=U5W1A5_9ACTN|nr:hypothetical protein AFR_23270 [Actinoplanes friuliensis DSM 7358]